MAFDKNKRVYIAGEALVDGFHLLGLFVIGATVVWTAGHEYLQMMQSGSASLKDILLLFIYLELGAMVGIYFKTQKIPVEFLLYIAITALTRMLSIDVKEMDVSHMMYLTLAILVLVVAVAIIRYSDWRYADKLY